MSKQLLPHTWNGTIAMTPGIGAFLGKAGDNNPHRHWAHQIAIGLDNDIEILSQETRYSAKGLWITAGTTHQLKTARVLSVYFDPTHNICKTLLPQHQSSDPVRVLDQPFTMHFLSKFNEEGNLQSALEALNEPCHCVSKNTNKVKLQRILLTLQEHTSKGEEISRVELAKMVHLSPSRFSHWFTENAGLPLRSYKKWLKLLTGFNLARTMPLTEAATSAGFSDQAHFCRAVSEAFGVKPRTLRKLFS